VELFKIAVALSPFKEETLRIPEVEFFGNHI